MSIPNPFVDTVLSNKDPGDDVLRRFRYQITCACILSLHMLDNPDANLTEIFCELHEDILAKYSDNSYGGIQVKTKDINLPPFNIEDDAIKSSCKKFHELDIKFPGQFRYFSIVTNTGFDRSKPAVCISSLIEKSKNGGREDLLKSRSKSKVFINYIVSECSSDEEAVIDTLMKVRLSHLGAIDDIHSKLIQAIKCSNYFRGSTESQIDQVADLLIAMHYKASSLSTYQDTTSSYILGVTDERDDVRRIIQGKRIEKNFLSNWCDEQKKTPVALLLKDRLSIKDLPRGYRRMEIKMDAGGIDAGTIDLMKNFKFSFENQVIQWLYKNGSDLSEEQYSQTLYVLQNICQEIYDEELTGEQRYGIHMLVRIRERIRQRMKDDKEIFFNCNYEHLLGAISVLTENCKVWWSTKFELANE